MGDAGTPLCSLGLGQCSGSGQGSQQSSHGVQLQGLPSPGRMTLFCFGLGTVPTILTWVLVGTLLTSSHTPRRSSKPQGPGRASTGVKVGMAGGCRRQGLCAGCSPSPGRPMGTAGTEPPLKWGGHGAVALLEQCAVSLAATPANPS